jgi:hypothetical protein
MRIIAIIFLGFAAFCGNLIGPSSQNEGFLQGSWRLAGEHKEEDGASRAWFLEWKFENGRFEQKGYPPILQKGAFKVVSDKDDRLLLRLSDQEGTFGKKEREIEIVIHRAAGEIDIDRSAGFQRLE